MADPPLIPKWLTRMFQSPITVFKAVYCEGSKDPEIVIPTLTGDVRQLIPCSEFRREHLHVQCQSCYFVWLEEVGDANAKLADGLRVPLADLERERKRAVTLYLAINKVRKWALDQQKGADCDDVKEVLDICDAVSSEVTDVK